jgi:AraC-like DNA-binding protein
MKFDSYIPGDILKPYIRALFISELQEADSYKVLPGTEIVMGFQYSGRLSYRANGEEKYLSTAGLTGLNDRFRLFSNSAGTGTVLVFFKEGALPTFFPHPVHELFGESVSLENFMLRSELLILEEKLQEASGDKARISVIEKYLISRMHTAPPDLLVLSALSLIYKSKGNIRIHQLVKSLHSSQSPVEKRFRQVIGTTPKKFAALVRFKNIVGNFKSSDSLTGLGYEAGFYDQAHFIKEFRRFTGESPENFFREK